jgi:hypothetical protein
MTRRKPLTLKPGQTLYHCRTRNGGWACRPGRPRPRGVESRGHAMVPREHWDSYVEVIEWFQLCPSCVRAVRSWIRREK